MLERAKALAPELVRLRRDIHAHPELSFQETRTAALVADTLQEVGGISIRTGIAKTGVIGELGNGDGPTIAIRADMDALPILEATGADYASGNRGVHHACGHDAHTAMLLGAAHLLRERFAAENLRGKVRFLFQPSEEAWDKEGKSGGLRMVEEGVMAGVDAVIAIHVDSVLPVGKVTIHHGWASAAVDDFFGTIVGTGGHGASPHNGTDPVFMLIPVLTALYGIRSRRIDPAEPGMLSVGIVQGVGATNVIPSEVEVSGTLRSYSPEVREQLIAEVERAFAVARAYGGDYRLRIERGYPAGCRTWPARCSATTSSTARPRASAPRTSRTWPSTPPAPCSCSAQPSTTALPAATTRRSSTSTSAACRSARPSSLRPRYAS
jgi:amidohydrolase